MSVVAAIREMLAKGVLLEDALSIAEAFEAQEPTDTRSATAKRQARYRERKQRNEVIKSVTKRNESVTDVTPANRNESNALLRKTVTNVTPLARVEDNSPELEISGKEEKNLVRKRNAVTPRGILLECLSPDSADAVLAHRRAKRCPLTVRAAQLLAKGFTATGDPNAAADMMIERGWQGFKPEWFDNERAENGQGRRQGKGSIVEAGRRLTERLVTEQRERELRAGKRVNDGDPPLRLLPGLGGQRP